MMISYHKVDKSSGKILSCGRTGGDIRNDSLDDIKVYTGHADRLTQYYRDGELTDRPQLEVQLPHVKYVGSEVSQVKNLPDGCDIRVNNKLVEHLIFNHPGQYHVNISLWPYREFDHQIKVIETTDQIKQHNDQAIKQIAAQSITKDYPIHRQINKILSAIEGIGADSDELKVMRDSINDIRQASKNARTNDVSADDFKAELEC